MLPDFAQPPTVQQAAPQEQPPVPQDLPHLPIRAYDHVYGDVTNPDLDMILIPRIVYHGQPGQVNVAEAIGHFTLGVYYPQTAQVYHFDSLNLPIDEDVMVYYWRAIRTLHDSDNPNARDYSMRGINLVPFNMYNRQTDGTSCGFFVSLYAEMLLLRGRDQMYLPNFGEQQLEEQRKRIIDFLYDLTNGHFPDYDPPPPSQQRADPAPEPPQQHQPIGNYVPYITDAPIRPAHVDVDQATTIAPSVTGERPPRR
jgi:hypothetical protein